jgi:hypothetical protein
MASPLPLQRANTVCYVADFSVLPDHLVSDTSPQRNPETSFHSSLSYNLWQISRGVTWIRLCLMGSTMKRLNVISQMLPNPAEFFSSQLKISRRERKNTYLSSKYWLWPECPVFKKKVPVCDVTIGPALPAFNIFPRPSPDRPFSS